MGLYRSLMRSGQGMLPALPPDPMAACLVLGPEAAEVRAGRLELGCECHGFGATAGPRDVHTEHRDGDACICFPIGLSGAVRVAGQAPEHVALANWPERGCLV